MRQRLRSLDAAILVPFAIFTMIWGSTWIVIRDQLGPDGLQAVSPHWSVTYRFVIAAAAMALLARVKGDPLWLGKKAILPVLILAFTQFFILTQGGPVGSTETLVFKIFNSQQPVDQGTGAVMAIGLFGITLVVSLAQFLLLERRVHYGN